MGRTLRVLVEGEASAKELKKANISSWEHGLIRETDAATAQLKANPRAASSAKRRRRKRSASWVCSTCRCIATSVPQADQFYINGAVHTPNMYRMEPGMTVAQAIARGAAEPPMIAWRKSGSSAPVAS